MSSSMKDSSYDDELFGFDYFVDNAVGKSLGMKPTNVLGRVLPLMEEWISRKRVEHR